jgi:hypothetical protein
MHLSSSGMWSANMDTGSSQSILQPRMSDSFKAWTCRDWLGTRAHWWGFKHCTLSLGGNCSKKVTNIYWKLHVVTMSWPSGTWSYRSLRLCGTYKNYIWKWLIVVHVLSGLNR